MVTLYKMSFVNINVLTQLLQNVLFLVNVNGNKVVHCSC